jgi:hypothetical protein
MKVYFVLFVLLCSGHAYSQSGTIEFTLGGSRFNSKASEAKWKAFRLLPHQTGSFEDQVVNGNQIQAPALDVYSALPLAALDKTDSLRKDAYAIAARLKKHYKDNKFGFSLNVGYYDKRRYPVGKVLIYSFAVGNQIELIMTHANPRIPLDAGLNDRLDSFKLKPNQYIQHDTLNRTIVLYSIIDIDTLKQPVETATFEKKESLRVMCEIVTRDKLKDYSTIQVGYVDQHSRGIPQAYVLNPVEFNIYEYYDEFEKLYKEHYPKR